jgi:hypothetical protein
MNYYLISAAIAVKDFQSGAHNNTNNTPTLPEKYFFYKSVISPAIKYLVKAATRFSISTKKYRLIRIYFYERLKNTTSKLDSVELF